MNEQEEIRVVGDGDLRGYIDPKDLEEAESDGTIRIRLQQGGVVSVPYRTLQHNEDGSYYVPLTTETLDDVDLADESRSVFVVPVIEEDVEIHKREVTTGRVRLKRQVSEREEVVDEPTFREVVEVERVPVNEIVDSPRGVRFEGDTMVIPVMEEQVVIEKRWLLKEEVRVSKRRTRISEPQRVMLQQENISVERLGPEGQASASD